jgi:hypothetical protein
MNTRKALFARGCVALVALVAITSNALAQTPTPISTGYDIVSLENRIVELEQMIYQMNASYGNGGSCCDSGCNDCEPAYGLVTDGCPGWIASVDFLHWTVRNAGFEYGITDIGGVQDRGAVGTVLEIGGDYENGIRFSFGRRMGSCCEGGPEVIFSYTDFESSQTEVFAGPLRATIVSADNSENNDSDDINTLGVETITPDDRATGATAIQRFDYQVYDLMFAQNLIMSDRLTLRLSAGARGAEIDQYKQVTYVGGDFQTPFTSFQDTDYQGAGVLAGLETRWYVLRDLSLNIGLTGGLMMGEYRTRTFIPDDEPGVPTNVLYSETRMTPIMEMMAAVEYTHHFNRAVVNLSAGYQFVNYFNMVSDREFYESHQEGTNAHVVGDLSLDGLYGRLGFNW